MFRAAFTSRSCSVLQAGQLQVRTLRAPSPFGLLRCPHAEQSWDDGYHWSIFTTRRPDSAALYSSIATNDDGVQLGHLAALLVSVLGSSLPTAQRSLGPAQGLLSLSEPAGVGDLLAGGEGGEVSQAEVDTDLGRSGGQRRFLDLDNERGVLAASAVEGDGDRAWSRGQLPAPAHAQVTDLRETQATVGEHPEPAVGRETYRLVVAAALRYRSRIAPSMLASCDKMRPSVEVATSVLHATPTWCS